LLAPRACVSAAPTAWGLANVKHDIWATSSSRGASGLTGPIGLVCQSGATAFGPFLVRAVESGIGFSYIISTGNEADLDFTDFARYLLDDPDTRVIAGFVEGFKEADKFLEVAKLAAERGKPIVLIKIGRSELGARAAPRVYGRASRIMLNGVSVARCTLRKPPAVMTSRNLASPACAPSAAPTSWASEVGTHTIVEAA
jgi:acyl-CoA synthetase (NDP forming)